jgi:hypothetical protein
MTETGNAVEIAKSLRRPGPPPRYTVRLVTMEEPKVVAELEEMAEQSGRSVASEVRAAVRYWISVNE